jgi:hypothetical protein
LGKNKVLLCAAHKLIAILDVVQEFRPLSSTEANGLFAWLVADDWCWFVLREKYCWLVAGG